MLEEDGDGGGRWSWRRVESRFVDFLLWETLEARRGRGERTDGFGALLDELGGGEEGEEWGGELGGGCKGV